MRTHSTRIALISLTLTITSPILSCVKGANILSSLSLTASELEK